MLSYTGRRNLFGQLVNDSTTATLSFGDTIMNDYEKQVLSSRPWWFVMRYNSDVLTVDGTQFYNVPFNYRKIDTVTVTSGTTNYNVQKCPSREFWDRLNFTSTPQSTWPQWYFIIDGQIGFWPIPSTDDLPINFFYEARFKDLSIADYTTGTIVTATNDSKAIVGSGTFWTDQMVRWIKITEANTDNTGDGAWYEIASIDSATTLTLKAVYQGNSIAAGSAAYTLAQISQLPEAYQSLPVYHACFMYFSSINPKMDRATMFKAMRDELMAQMVQDQGKSGSQSNVDLGPRLMQNVNLFHNS